MHKMDSQPVITISLHSANVILGLIDELHQSGADCNEMGESVRCLLDLLHQMTTHTHQAMNAYQQSAPTLMRIPSLLNSIIFFLQTVPFLIAEGLTDEIAGMLVPLTKKLNSTLGNIKQLRIPSGVNNEEEWINDPVLLSPQNEARITEQTAPEEEEFHNDPVFVSQTVNGVKIQDEVAENMVPANMAAAESATVPLNKTKDNTGPEMLVLEIPQPPNHVDAFTSRLRDNHIRRDRDQQDRSTMVSAFPGGEGVRAEFQAAFVNFKSFAWDSVDCLEEMKSEGVQMEDPTGELVYTVMGSIFNETLRFVKNRLDVKRDILRDAFGVDTVKDEVPGDESVSRLFWYQTQQVRFPAEIAALTDQQILELIEGMEPLVKALYQFMVVAAEKGTIDKGEQTLRIPQLVRHFLRLHTITMLSDPRCYLLPAPVQTVRYEEGRYTETLSPGVRKYGPIREGDVVEVVLPGLYFEAQWSNVRPIVPCLVRRLVKVSAK